MGRTFYRIIRGPIPTLADFLSHKQHRRPLRDPKWAREWAEGISVYPSLDYAKEQARTLRYRAGRYVVPLDVPDDGSIDVAQTMGDPLHHTIYVTGEAALALVSGPAIAVEEAP